MNENIPKPILDALAREATPSDHPSADVLAAFVEHALAEAEKQSVTDHLARCGECREIVFLASGAVEEPAAQSEAMLVTAAARAPQDRLAVAHAAAGIPSSTSLPKLRWRWTSRWVWAIPVAAILLLGAGYLLRKIYVAVPGEREIASKSSPEKASGPPAQLPEVATARPSPATPAPSPMAKERPRTTPPTTLPARKAPPVNADVIAMNAPLTPAGSETVRAKLASPKSSSEAPVMAIGGAIAGAAPAARRGNGFAPTTSETDRQYGAGDSLSFSVNRGLAGVARTTHPAWRVTLQGHLEHLTPDGWSRVLADQVSVFRVVSVVGNDVWAGGNDGMFFHSGDGGTHWNRLSIASPGSSETAAIVSIRFDDGQHGAVITDTDAKYSTTDGGMTWTKQ
jgi:hypothetical protein